MIAYSRSNSWWAPSQKARMLSREIESRLKLGTPSFGFHHSQAERGILECLKKTASRLSSWNKKIGVHSSLCFPWVAERGAPSKRVFREVVSLINSFCDGSHPFMTVMGISTYWVTSLMTLQIINESLRGDLSYSSMSLEVFSQWEMTFSIGFGSVHQSNEPVREIKNNERTIKILCRGCYHPNGS